MLLGDKACDADRVRQMGISNNRPDFEFMDDV